MKKILLLLLAGLALMGAMKSSDNLLLNGELEELQLGFPPFWERIDFDNLIYMWTEGPEASGVFSFQSEGISSHTPMVVQKGTVLVSGEKYSLELKIRSKDFHAEEACFALKAASATNDDWVGIANFPENCPEWTDLKKEIIAPSSNNGKYDIAIFLKNFSGRLDITDVRLYALTEKALALSCPTEGIPQDSAPRIFPYSPLLQEIPAEKPVLTFKRGGLFHAITPYPAKDVEAVFTVDGNEIARCSAAEEILCPLNGIATGAHILRAALILKSTGKEIFRREHEIQIVKTANFNATVGTRLNNFVVELLKKDIEAGLQESLSLQDEKWLFINAPQGVLFDGEELHGENFRFASSGTHALKALETGHVIVRAISEIFTSAVCENSRVPQNPRYDWDFARKYVFQALTTANRFACPDGHLEEWHKSGLRWLGNIVTVDAKDAADFQKRLDESIDLHDQLHDGVTLDEHYYSQAVMPDVADVLWKYRPPAGKLIYTWTTGLPFIQNSVALEYIAAVLNASQGKGRLLVESYCASQETEERMMQYLNRRLNGCFNAYKAANPMAAKRVAMILGNFNQSPMYSLDAIPDVDFKRTLDLAMHRLATHPDFIDMPVIGYWGNHYATEEMYRWSVKLLRHYCVEGKRNLLSDEYGFKYIPGHLVNGDFKYHFDNWKVEVGDGGQIRWEAIPSLYGRLRWGSDVQNGTTCCVFVRGNKPSCVSQNITGLVPGRPYVLQFITGDYASLKKGHYVNKTHNVNAVLDEEVETITKYLIDGSLALSDWDRRSVKIHYWRFIPKTDSMTIVFSDEAASIGDSFTLNNISLRPYFEEE